ncbi:MAG TPA: VOC family protein [Candidatus Dormibacteraeota bacterium]
MTRIVAGLAEVVLWVRDMDEALHFYRDLFGLEVISPSELPNKFLRAGGGADGVPEMIVLVPHPDPSMEFPRAKAKRVLNHMAFRVEAAEYENLRDRLVASGIEVRSGIHPVLKGVRTFYADDPDGNECEAICLDPDHPDATKTGYETEDTQRLGIL